MASTALDSCPIGKDKAVLWVHMSTHKLRWYVQECLSIRYTNRDHWLKAIEALEKRKVRGSGGIQSCHDPDSLESESGYNGYFDQWNAEH